MLLSIAFFAHTKHRINLLQGHNHKQARVQIRAACFQEELEYAWAKPPASQKT
jgi:hypothetical protein